MTTPTGSEAERALFEAYWLKRQRARGFGCQLTDAEMLARPERREDEFCAWQAARAPGDAREATATPTTTCPARQRHT